MNKLDFLSKFAVNGVHYNQNQILDEMVNSDDYRVRLSIAIHPNLTTQQIDKLVNDISWRIRYDIAKNKNLTQEQVDKLAQDEDSDVRDQALEHTLYKQGIKS